MNRVEVLLSMQRALWDEVTPDLRGVAVHGPQGMIRARFFFDHEIGEEERETVSMVETEVIADFYPPPRTEFLAEHLPLVARRQLPSDGEWHWVYLRRERPAP